MSLYLLPLFAPPLLLAAAVFALLRSGRRPRGVPLFAEGAALGALVIAIASLALLLLRGTGDSGLIGWGGIGLSARLDAVNVTMLLLVAFVGWIVVRYARTYLDGEARQGYFTGWLCIALAAVLLLVQAGNVVQVVIAWIATSIAMHRLLLFYPERVEAQRAARKKRLFSTTGGIALTCAALLLWNSMGTTDIATINALARSGQHSWALVAAAALLALAAVLKSAQFPTHGWLTEMMEAPTPVSALLHAGVING
ncbi:oxidoreductase, partial [Xanthomonas oryzae pv. oryzae]